jgi:hypothetical protein
MSAKPPTATVPEAAAARPASNTAAVSIPRARRTAKMPSRTKAAQLTSELSESIPPETLKPNWTSICSSVDHSLIEVPQLMVHEADDRTLVLDYSGQTKLHLIAKPILLIADQLTTIFDRALSQRCLVLTAEEIRHLAIVLDFLRISCYQSCTDAILDRSKKYHPDSTINTTPDTRLTLCAPKVDISSTVTHSKAGAFAH